MNDRFKFRIPMFTDKGSFIEFQYLELGDTIDCTLCGINGEPQQCTGRKDQNGVLIYEGDIVERDNTDGIKRGVVEFSDNFCVFRATNMSKFSLFERAFVIGNIYENKELLETFTKYGYLKKLQECK